MKGIMECWKITFLCLAILLCAIINAACTGMCHHYKYILILPISSFFYRKDVSTNDIIMTHLPNGFTSTWLMVSMSNPSCLQTVSPLLIPQKASLHTVPQVPLKSISTLPSVSLTPSTPKRRTDPSGKAIYTTPKITIQCLHRTRTKSAWQWERFKQDNYYYSVHMHKG